MDIIRDVEKKHEELRFPDFKEFLAKVEKNVEHVTENLKLTIKIGQKSTDLLKGFLKLGLFSVSATSVIATQAFEKGETNARFKT